LSQQHAHERPGNLAHGEEDEPTLLMVHAAASVNAPMASSSFRSRYKIFELRLVDQAEVPIFENVYQDLSQI
jgi:hypothetical protein